MHYQMFSHYLRIVKCVLYPHHKVVDVKHANHCFQPAIHVEHYGRIVHVNVVGFNIEVRPPSDFCDVFGYVVFVQLVASHASLVAFQKKIKLPDDCNESPNVGFFGGLPLLYRSNFARFILEHVIGQG